MRELIKKSSLFFAGQTVSKLITTGIYIWLARLLSPHDYGLAVFLILLLTINTFIFELGLGQWYQKNVTEVNRKTLFQKIMQIRLYLAVIGTILCSLYLAINNYENTFILLFAIASFIDIPTSLATSYYLERKKPLPPSISLLFRGIGTGLLMAINIPHVTLYHSVLGYIFGGFVWLLIWFPEKSFYIFKSSFQEVKDILKQSIHFAYLQITSFAYARADSFIIVSFLGPAHLGWYGTAYRYLETLTMFPNALAQNLFHISAKEHIPARTLIKLTAFSAFLGVGVALCVFLGSNFLIIDLMGQKYAPAVTILQILSIVVFLFFLNAPIATSIQSSKLLKQFLPFGIGNTLFNIILNIIFIPLFGIQAAAWNMAITEFAGFLINVYFAKKLYS